MECKISYIIITWNGLTLLQDLIHSLAQQMQREDVEVIVVDNGSTDGTQQWLLQNPAIQTILLDENRGVAAARNVAMRQAKGEYLFILDNDIIANDKALTELEAYMDSQPQTGIAATALLLTDGSLQESCKAYPGIGQKVGNMLRRGKFSFYYARELAQGEPFEPTYVIGACQMIRRATYEQIGELDERIFYGPEDCDYCLRAQQNGWKVVYLPYAKMIHHCQRKTNTNPFTRLGLYHMKGLMYFYRKHRRFF